jgi:adenylate cyclase
VHFLLAFWAIYERRTFRLPPLELLRIALGLWLPVLLMGHVAATRLEFELMGASPTYGRIVAELWASNSEWRQIGLLAPGWLHGCLGLYFVFRHRFWWRRLQFVLFAFALLLPVLSALGFLTMGRDIARRSAAETAELSEPLSAEERATHDAMKMAWRIAVGLRRSRRRYVRGARGAHHGRTPSARAGDHNLS